MKKGRQQGKFVVLASMVPRELAMDVRRLAKQQGITPSMLIRNIVGPIVREQLGREP